jgi:hypothetical protein
VKQPSLDSNIPFSPTSFCSKLLSWEVPKLVASSRVSRGTAFSKSHLLLCCEGFMSASADGITTATMEVKSYLIQDILAIGTDKLSSCKHGHNYNPEYSIDEQVILCDYYHPL